MHHELKIWPQFFCRVADGSKTFEIRSNDRGYQPGDTVLLREWNPEETIRRDEHPLGYDEYKVPRGYTGGQVSAKIGYIFPLDAGCVVFSLLNVQKI